MASEEAVFQKKRLAELRPTADKEFGGTLLCGFN